MKIYFLAFIIIPFLYFSPSVYAAKRHVLENSNLKIFYENFLGPVAEDIVTAYPDIKAALENSFGWSLNLRPSVLLIKDSNRFHHMGISPLIVAFADTRSNTIVIDYTKMSQNPFTLENTLKHEMCHLLLHHHIQDHILPRWLDEGVCQWVSDGISNIIMHQKRSLLNRSAHRDAFIPLDALRRRFPLNNNDMQLAYEESKSFVAYLISKYDKDGLLKILNYMKEGETVEQACLKAFSTSLNVLEREWQDSLKRKATWFTLFSTYLYEILFGFTALISIYAFIKITLKKRTGMSEDPDDGLLS